MCLLNAKMLETVHKWWWLNLLDNWADASLLNPLAGRSASGFSMQAKRKGFEREREREKDNIRFFVPRQHSLKVEASMYS